MSDVNFCEVTMPVFGKCLHITNSCLELYVTLDFGPRVIHFSVLGKPNMFYEDKDLKNLGEKFECYGGEHMKLYGGHRIWVAPEILPRCYYPDNKPVSYRVDGNRFEFSAPVEIVNNIQKILTIEVYEEQPAVTLFHTIKNCGNWDVELAPWCVTMLDKGGKSVMPVPTRETGFLPNKNFSFWEYSALNDSRLYFGKEYLTLSQNPDIEEPFKIGYNNESGWAAYFNKGQVFFKYFEHETGGYLPDGGCSYESYTNGTMLESETLGEIQLIQPGSEITHIEEWEIFEEEHVPENNEKDIKDTIEKYVNI